MPGRRRTAVVARIADTALTILTAVSALAVVAWMVVAVPAPPASGTTPSLPAVGTLAGRPSPQAPAPGDPGEAGPYGIETSDYELAPTDLVDVGFPVEMLGHVVSPTDAPGRRPLVLFLHGKHVTCYDPGSQQADITWPCPAGWEPVPSHLGYGYLQRLLASQGYVTVSISANGIAGQPVLTPDQGAAARAQLVRRHLQQWVQWNAGTGSSWSGRLDLDRVTLVGHSRGGEGVHAAAVTSRRSAGYRVDGVVLLAPSDIGLQALPGIPSVTMFGYCDGDLPSLEGQRYAEAARVLDDGGATLRSDVLVMGANHNWFNTEWTPSTSVAGAEDDWYLDANPVCGADADARLSPAAQRAVAKAYVAGAVRLFARSDEAVLPMFDGSLVDVPSAGGAVVRTSAVGADRDLVPAGELTATATGAVTVSSCRGWSEGPTRACAAGMDSGRTPHWPIGDQYPYPPGQRVVEVSWAGGHGSARLALPAPTDLSTRTHLDARVAVGSSVDAVRMRVRLTDSDGESIVLTPRAGGRLPALPGGPPLLGKLWAQTLRTPLAAAAGPHGVDLSRVASVDLLPASARGRVWLLDLAGRRPGLPGAAARPVPVVDVPDLETVEGDGSDPQHLDLPLRVRDELTRPARLLVRVSDPDQGAVARSTVVVRPGEPASIPVPFERDDIDDGPYPRYLTALVMSADGRAAIGDYAAVLTVRDDDPAPAVRVSRVEPRVDEGADLRWRLRLAAPVEYGTAIGWQVVRGEPGSRALSTDDVPASWLRGLGVRPPADPVALWRLDGAQGSLDFGFETRAGAVRIPTRLDPHAESAETLTLRFGGANLLREPVIRTITVVG